MHLIHQLRNRLLVGLSDCQSSKVLAIVDIYQSVDIYILDVLESSKHNLSVIFFRICKSNSNSLECNSSICHFATLFFFLLDEFVDLDY